MAQRILEMHWVRCAPKARRLMCSSRLRRQRSLSVRVIFRKNESDFSVIKACIFDLDGVIVDTAHYHFVAWKRLAKELGVVLTEKENERLKGVSRMRSLEIILGMGGILLGEGEKEKLTEKKNGWFVGYVNAMKPEEIFPGVKKLIQDLKNLGIKVALASSSKNAGTVVRLLKLEKEFDAIVDGKMIFP